MDEVAAVESRRKLGKKSLLIAAALLCSVFIVAMGIFLKLTLGSDGLPTSITSQASFAIYYPSRLPKGYSLQQDTPRFGNGILFFSVSDTKNFVGFSEQSLPNNPPDLEALMNSNTSFKHYDSNAGTSIIGIDTPTSKPVAIVLTNTSLITIRGSKDTPKDVIVQLTQNLQSLPR